MIDIPSPLSTDPEDVAWALSTAEAMWKREGHLDALTWVRRAADAAEAAGDNERAIMLMRSAADISEWIRDNAPNEKSAPAEEPPPAEPLPSVAVPPSRPPQSTMDVDEEELLDIEVEIEEEAPRSPFVSASGVTAWDDEEVVTSAPRIGALGTPRAKGPPGPPPKKPPGPPPRRPPTGAPPPPRAPEPAIVSEEEAAPISSSALILEDGEPAREPTPPPPEEAPVARPHIPPEPTLASPKDPASTAVPKILTGRSTTHRQWPARAPDGENIEETQAEWPPQEPTLLAGAPAVSPATPPVVAPDPEATPIVEETPASPQMEETQTEWPPQGDEEDDVANELAAAIAADAISVAKSSAEEEVPLSEGAFEDLGSIESPLPAFDSAPEAELPTFQDEQARAAFASNEVATSLRVRSQDAETETAAEAIAKEAQAAAPAEGSRASSGSMRAAKAPVLDFDGDILEPESERPPPRPASHAPPRRHPTAPPPAKIAEKTTAPSQPPTRKVSMPAELIEASLAQERARRQQAEQERRAAAERERAELERAETAERERVEKERRDAAEKSQAERAARLASELPPSPPPPEAVVEAAAPAAPSSAAGPPDLSNVPELDDLPEDVLAAFAAASEVHLLAKDEEANGFALAYVLEGELDLSATVADVPAARIGAGTMVRTRGTVDAHLDVRLVGISQAARVVTWDAAAVSTALRDCPWVEDDLRAAGDRWQALAGVTLGALGDRLDPELRGALMAELESRTLAPGEVLAKMGESVPGLFVVGAGEVLLQQDGAEVGALTPGDVVFPGETISHQKAPSTAVAGAGGAVVLGADRKRMQELLMTFPPLLDLLASL